MEILIASKQYALKNLFILNAPHARLVFLSDDYQSYVKLRNTLSSEKKLELLDNRFHEKLDKIKDSFLKLSACINQLNNFDAFWGTQLASRHSSGTPFLKDIVYTGCAKDIMSEKSAPVVFIVDRLSLAKTLYDLAQSMGLKSKLLSTFRDKLQAPKMVALLPVRALYFFISNLSAILFSKFLKNPRLHESKEKEKVLLCSWITAGNVNDQSQYTERNFGPLKDFLTKKNREVWVLPTCFNLDRSYLKQLKLMSQSSTLFLFPEQYLGLRDLLHVVIRRIKTLQLIWPQMLIDGCDVSRIVKMAAFGSAFGVSFLKFDLVYSLFKKLSRIDHGIMRLIYPIENNAVEKTLIRATRKFLPHTRLIGFQHSVWYKEQLGMELAPGEVEFHPLPDKIICSGPSYLDILKTLNFPANLLTCGPSLRFLDIYKYPLKKWGLPASETKTALVVLNFDINQCLEVLDKLNQAIKSIKIKVVIKSHPLLNKEYLCQYLRSIHFQEYAWVEGQVPQLAINSDVVIMPFGSVSNLETIAIGTPLIRINLENNFNFDPLWESRFSFGDANDVADLIFFLKKALDLDKDAEAKLSSNAITMRHRYFEPYSDKGMEQFL